MIFFIWKHSTDKPAEYSISIELKQHFNTVYTVLHVMTEKSK